MVWQMPAGAAAFTTRRKIVAACAGSLARRDGEKRRQTQSEMMVLHGFGFFDERLQKRDAIPRPLLGQSELSARQGGIDADLRSQRVVEAYAAASSSKRSRQAPLSVIRPSMRWSEPARRSRLRRGGPNRGCGPDADAPIVAEICRALDGLPLAIEFAAAPVDALGVRGIAARLQEGLTALTVAVARPRRDSKR